jgi:hypothetical protein
MRNAPRASMEFDKELSESWVAAMEAMRLPRMVTVWSFSSLPLPTLMTVTWRTEASTEFSAADFSCLGARQTPSRSAKYRSSRVPQAAKTDLRWQYAAGGLSLLRRHSFV